MLVLLFVLKGPLYHDPGYHHARHHYHLERCQSYTGSHVVPMLTQQCDEADNDQHSAVTGSPYSRDSLTAAVR